MSALNSAFLSVRLPEAMRDRLKAVAASRGKSVQGLVGDLVARFLIEEDRQAPALSTVLNALRAQRPVLEGRGVMGLWVFGSAARGDAGVDSDVDLLVDFHPGAAVSLVGLASLQGDLSDILGHSVDLVERGAMAPAARCSAEQEAVQVF
jgi:predicted nucleotidyltransferase